MSRRARFLVVFAVAMWLIIPAATIAAEEPDQAYAPKTTGDPGIPLDELDIVAAPLTVEELKGEADGWLSLVKQAAERVAETKLRIKRANRQLEAAEKESEPAQERPGGQQAGAETAQDAAANQAEENKDAALDELTELRAERTALIDRLDIILQRINQKIGLDEQGKEKEEVLVYRRYADAVGGIQVDVSDAESAIASVTGWLISKEGGLRWAQNIALFVVIVIAFAFLGRFLGKATGKGLEVSGNRSVLLSDFLVNIVRRGTLLIGIVVGLSALEVNIGPMLAVIGAAGFVVAFALQDTLSNFANGIMIMLYRPFDVDDAVEVAGISGTVRALNLVSTTITTFDNKRMVVPNNQIWGNIITNATGSSERRVDMVFGIGYEDDVAQAKTILEEIVGAHPNVLKDPAPVVQLHELGDSSVNFICRPWTKTADYWAVYWDVTRSVKERFDAEGISIPFPQRDVHIYHERKALPEADSRVDNTDTAKAARQMEKESIDDDIV